MEGQSLLSAVVQTKPRSHRDRIQRLLDAALETLHMDVAFVTELNGTEQTFTHLTGDAKSFGWEPGTTIPEGDGYCHDVLAGELSNAVPSTQRDPLAAGKAATVDAAIGSYLGVPLTLGNGRVYGALCVSSHNEHFELGPAEVAFMNFLARLVADELTEQEREEAAQAVHVRELTAWLAPGGMTILLQPIVDLASGTIRGVEALTRFRGYTGSPADVFSAATDAGMGVELELAAVRAALLLLSPLPKHLYLSVNVSPATAKSSQLEDLLLGISAERIILELTEHARFTDHSHLVARLQALKAHGVRIAIDDAGSGYSGLQIILALAPDVIKLDIALVKNVDQDPVRRSLVRAMTGFAAESGATIIAEGIETQTELDTLRELGVNLGQGFHLFRPAPIDDLTWPTDPIASLGSGPMSRRFRTRKSTM